MVVDSENSKSDMQELVIEETDPMMEKNIKDALSKNQPGGRKSTKKIGRGNIHWKNLEYTLEYTLGTIPQPSPEFLGPYFEPKWPMNKVPPHPEPAVCHNSSPGRSGDKL